jgi:hypothetical protein
MSNHFLYHSKGLPVATRVCRSPFAAAGSVKLPLGISRACQAPALASGDESDGRWRRKGPSGWVSAGRRRKQRTKYRNAEGKQVPFSTNVPTYDLLMGLLRPHSKNRPHPEGGAKHRVLKSEVGRGCRCRRTYGTLPRIEAGWPGSFSTLPVSTTLSP